MKWLILITAVALLILSPIFEIEIESFAQLTLIGVWVFVILDEIDKIKRKL